MGIREHLDTQPSECRQCMTQERERQGTGAHLHCNWRLQENISLKKERSTLTVSTLSTQNPISFKSQDRDIVSTRNPNLQGAS